MTKVENGKLIVTSENQQHAGVDLYNLTSDKYAVQFDLRVLDISSLGHCIFETSNDAKYGTSSWRAVSAGFFSDGHAIPAHYIHPDRFEDFEGVIGEYDLARSNTVTLIFLGDQIAAFTDGALIYTVLDPDGSVIFATQALSANYTAQCEYDNFKIWDLSGVDFSSAVGTPAPEVTMAFYEPIITYIEAQSPTFEDDFSSSKQEWGNTSEGIPISEMNKEQALSIRKNNDANMTFPTNGLFDATNFVIQFDLSFSPQTSITNLAFQFRTSTSQDTHYQIKFSDMDVVDMTNKWQFLETQENKSKMMAGGLTNMADGFKRISIVANEGHLAIFVNNILLLERENISLTGRENFFDISEEPSDGDIWVDNVKFWNLDGVDFNP